MLAKKQDSRENVDWIKRAVRGKLVVLRAWEGLRKEVSNVGGACNVSNQKLELLDPILDPLEPHIDTLR